MTNFFLDILIQLYPSDCKQDPDHLMWFQKGTKSSNISEWKRINCMLISNIFITANRKGLVPIYMYIYIFSFFHLYWPFPMMVDQK